MPLGAGVPDGTVDCAVMVAVNVADPPVDGNAVGLAASESAVAAGADAVTVTVAELGAETSPFVSLHVME